jgi:hypothetical protein
MRLAVLEQLGDVLATAGDYNAARAVYATGLSLTAAGNRVRRARWSRKAAESDLRQRLYAEALTHIEAASAALGDAPADDPAWEYEHGWVLLNRIYAAYWTADLAAMIEWLGPARETILKSGDASQLTELHRMEQTVAWRRKRFLMDDEVIQIADAHLAAAREYGHLEAIGWALTMRGMSALLHYPRQLDEAESFLKAGIETSDRAGSTDVALVGRHWLTYLHRTRGDVAAVAEHAEALLPLTDSVAFYRGAAQADLGWVALRRGDREAADAWSQRAVETLAGAPPMVNWMAYLVLLRLAWDEGRTADAVEFVRAMLAPGQMTFPAPLRERYEAAVAAWDAGQSDAAHAELGHALRLAEELGYS